MTENSLRGFACFGVREWILNGVIGFLSLGTIIA